MTKDVRMTSRPLTLRATTRWLAAGTAALTFMTATAGAQTTTGSIRGYVRGPNNTPVAEAQIAARNAAMGTNRGTTSNSSGFYNLAGLRPGDYELTVRRIGFSPQTRTVTVGIGQTITVDVSIQEAATQIAAVAVTATASTETARTSEVGTNVTAEQIQRLPNFERNFLDLARLAPGITPTAVNNTDKFISAGGQPPEAVNVFVDGATYKNDVLRGGVVGQDASKGNPFPQGAVQEFRIITQNYKAEYQKAASAIITATTRSGSNQWEADAFGFGIGKSYVALDAFSAQRGDPRPDYTRLQAGGSLGGPIVKDKLFLFGTYEFNGRDEPQYVRLGPDSLVAPAPLLAQLRPLTGQFTSQFREHLGFGKLTWEKSARSTIDVSGTLRRDTDFRGFGGTTVFEAAENLDVNVYTGVANWKYAGDRWLNEAQVNYQHFTWGAIPKTATPIAQDYQSLLRIGGKDASQDFTQDRLSLRNDITRTVVAGGNHVIKGGASVDFLSYEAVKNQQATPVYRYRKDENFARPFEAVYGFGDPKVSTNNEQIGAYIQDDWTPTPRLVVNLGLRWDMETNMINNDYVTPRPLADSLAGPLNSKLSVTRPVLKPDGTCCNDTQVRVIDELGGLNRFITSGRSDRPNYLKAWQPRVGASYDVTGSGRTVLFGGAGIYYDRNYWNTLFDERFRRQYNVPRIEFRDACPAGSPVNCVVWDPKYLDPAQLRTLSGTAGVPEVFLVANDLTPPKSYQFSGGVRQGLGRALVTLSYNGVRGQNGMNFVQASPGGGLGPNYATLFITDDRVKSWYDAMQLQIERGIQSDTRWGGSIAYTLARADEQGQTTDLFWGFDNKYPTVGDLPRRRAPGNQTHTITANGIVRIPYQIYLSGIVNLGTGLTVNAVDNTRGSAFGEQVSYVYQPPTRPFLGIGNVFATQLMDLRVEKAFSLASAQRLSLVADLFNVFNSANYGCYTTTIENPPNPNYNTPGCAGLGRRLQVGLRYGLQPIASAGTPGQ